MNESSTRDALKQLSALGAGVLLAATPHCGGKSESAPGDDSGGRTRGGASGSAGYGGVGAGAYGGSVGTGGVGSYGGSYGGSVGTGGVGSYGGAVGIGGCSATALCFTPAELVGCYQDAGVDGGDAGAPGEGGFAGQASEPAEISIPRPPDAGAVDASVDASDVPEYACPTPFPVCVPPPPPFATIFPPTFNGVACCYPVSLCGI